MRLYHRFCFWLGIAALGLSAATSAPIADCKPCGIALAIPHDGLWQGLQKGDLTTFAMQRGNELFATIEVMKFNNEARYDLNQLAAHYQEYFNMDFAVDGPFASRQINGIPARWGRGHGRSEDGSEFLIHLVFFTAGEESCYLLTVVPKQAKKLHEYLMPEIIQSMRRLPPLSRE
jgi:hypothetical protein